MGRPIKRIETAVDKAMAELRTMGWKTGTPKDMEYDCCQDVHGEISSQEIRFCFITNKTLIT